MSLPLAERWSTVIPATTEIRMNGKQQEIYSSERERDRKAETHSLNWIVVVMENETNACLENVCTDIVAKYNAKRLKFVVNEFRERALRPAGKPVSKCYMQHVMRYNNASHCTHTFN